MEELGVCALISNALNESSSMALRTTELTALSVLSGECALHSNALNSNTIDFESMKMRLQLSIPTFVAEPEFQELFECAINLGASKSSFIPELIRFGSKFVNQKHRQLRLQSFVETNKVNINCPERKQHHSRELTERTLHIDIVQHLRPMFTKRRRRWS